MALKSSEICLDSHRRQQIRSRGHNGIDYVDVGNDLRTITVHLLRRPPEDLTARNVVLEGGARKGRLKVTELQFCFVDDPSQEDTIRLVLERPGDRATYTLKLVELSETGEPTDMPFRGFDPKYFTLQFHFVTDAAMGLDCVQDNPGGGLPSSTIDINYLTKDYTTFRQLVLDRLALIMPGWTEQHIADEGIALVEILAYVADYLSYYQDAVGTEAYLTTARQRISVRRHVRLLDYPMHEGCNSRTWLQIQTSNDIESLWSDPDSVLFLSGFDGNPGSGTILSLADIKQAPAGSFRSFQPSLSKPVPLRQAHNRILFYTWGNHDCYLAEGATGATLEDLYLPDTEGKAQSNPPAQRVRSLSIQPGDYLLLEEALGPLTGVAADADPTRRWVVRITQAVATFDPLNDLPIVEIEWDKADALPFPLCLATRGPAPDCRRLKHISIARGNICLVDEGSPVVNESLGTVAVALVTQRCRAENHVSPPSIQSAPFSSTLKVPQLVWRNAPDASAPACTALIQDPRTALPEIELRSIAPLEDGSGPLFSLDESKNPELLAMRLTHEPFDAATKLLRDRLPRKTIDLLGSYYSGQEMSEKLAYALTAEIDKATRYWSPRRDLLNSASNARDYVVEMDDAQVAHLRFGDGTLGTAPQPGEMFFASYRVASGSLGNIGRETIKHLVYFSGEAIQADLTIDNPLPASGGTDPEPVTEVKMYAPRTFLNQLDRAITAADYEQLAERNRLVQRAAASLIWTGSRYEARVAIDPVGTDHADPDLLKQVEHYLYPFRRIGHDLRVVQAEYVPLDLMLDVQVAPGYLAAHVKLALLHALGNHKMPGGKAGLFHPDNLTFGQSIYASQIISAAQMVDGVEGVTIVRLERLFEEEHRGLVDGVLVIGPLEIAQLDNDASHPERGRLRLQMRGGR